MKTTDRRSRLTELGAGILALLAAVGIAACQSPSLQPVTPAPAAGQAQGLSGAQTDLLRDYAGDVESAAPAGAIGGEAGPGTGDVMGFVPQKVTGNPDSWPFVALDDPDFVTADNAGFLDPGDLVLGVALGGEAKAYPTAMMWFHHVANDTIGGQPIAVTY